MMLVRFSCEFVRPKAILMRFSVLRPRSRVEGRQRAFVNVGREMLGTRRWRSGLGSAPDGHRGPPDGPRARALPAWGRERILGPAIMVHRMVRERGPYLAGPCGIEVPLSPASRPAGPRGTGSVGGLMGQEMASGGQKGPRQVEGYV